MAFKDFKEFIERTLFEEVSEPNAKQTQLPPEELAELETTIAKVNNENVTEQALAIIAASQVDADNDEYPDISKVQTAVEIAGSGANHELICRMLVKYENCEPKDLEKDGLKRKQAILSAIEHTQKQGEAINDEKAKEEEMLAQAERDAETACTEAINQANVECEKAIEEEKKRSAAIIVEIRQRAEEATMTAKQQRDETLNTISAQRAENELALRNSAALVAETEKQGQIVLSQIDEWLGYLK